MPIWPVSSGMRQGRTDQGVDWSNTGTLYAVGAGTIVNVGANDPGGWGKVWIALKLDNPVDALHSIVYYAEDIAPSVSVGQHVSAGQALGQATGGSSGVEIGWADPNNLASHAALGKAQFNGTNATAEGVNFLKWIQSGATVASNQVQATSVPPYSQAIAIINQDIPSGQNPTWAEKIALVLLVAGIPLTTQAWADLLAQSSLEYGDGPHGNNLLGTSLQVNGSTAVNGDGVQAYKTWQDGVYAAAKSIDQANNRPMHDALYSAATQQSYATALAASSWEGNNPAAAAANAQYGQAFLSRYNSLTSAGGMTINGLGLMEAIRAAQSLAPGTLSGAGMAGQANPELGPATGFGSWGGAAILEDILKAIQSGFGIGWSGILTIILGALFIGFGIIVIFHRQAAQVGHAAVNALA